VALRGVCEFFAGIDLHKMSPQVTGAGGQRRNLALGDVFGV
jgi:hypothetical protein